MLTTEEIYQRTRKHFDEAAARELSLLLSEIAEQQRSAHSDLATKQDVSRLETALETLAQAQARTEERLDQLAQAQARTEERLDQLAQAQARTEEELKQLAQAQTRTEASIRVLAERMDQVERRLGNVQQELGGLSHAVGYGLEDQALKALPVLLRAQYGIEVQGRLRRQYIEHPDGREDEINIAGEGTRNGDHVHIIGECKSQLSTKHVDRFLQSIPRLESHFPGEKFLLCVTYAAPPSVVRHAEQQGVAVIQSSEF